MTLFPECTLLKTMSIPAVFDLSAFIPAAFIPAGSIPSACIPAAFLPAAAFTDLKSRRIPNLLVLCMLFPGGFLLGPLFLKRLVLASLTLYPLQRLRLAGAGDVKLAACVAAWAGFERFLFFFLFSMLAAAVPALLLLFRGRRRAGIPLAPFYLAGWAGACLAVPITHP